MKYKNFLYLSGYWFPPGQANSQETSIIQTKEIGMLDFLYEPDADFNTTALDFVTKAKASPTNYGVTLADITPVETLLTAFNTSLTDHVAAMAAARSKREAKDNARALLLAGLRSVASKMEASGQLDTAEALSLHFHVRDMIQTLSVPQGPVNLLAHGYENGDNTLSWDTGGNQPGTIYVPQYRLTPAGEWKSLRPVTKTTYVHRNQTPGAKVDYRVGVAHTDEDYLWSNVITVYAG